MVHQYKLGGYNIVLDVCSGAVHVVDEVAYDIIAMFETADKAAILGAMAEKYADRADISKEDIAECYGQVVALKDAGKLFVDKCKFDDLNDYTNICESVDFYNIVIAYIKSKSAPQTEATAGCEVNADVPEVNTSYGTESII